MNLQTISQPTDHQTNTSSATHFPHQDLSLEKMGQIDPSLNLAQVQKRWPNVFAKPQPNEREQINMQASLTTKLVHVPEAEGIEAKGMAEVFQMEKWNENEPLKSGE